VTGNEALAKLESGTTSARSLFGLGSAMSPGNSVRQLTRRFIAGAIVFAAASYAVDARAQSKLNDGPLGTEAGFGVFQQHCTSCHGNPDAPQRAPSPSTLRQLAPEKIYETLASGTMKVQARSLSDEEKRRVAESLSGRPFGSAQSGDAKNMPNHCSGNALSSFDPSAGPAWNGWGVDIANTRFQAKPGLTVDQVPRLKLRWAFGYPNGVTAAGQPTIVAGRVFVGTDIGYVYSLDAATGCVYWSFQAKASVRNAISIGPVTGHEPAKYAAYFGDGKANVYAVDASSGELLWMTHVEDHFTARITGAPTLHDGRLYVPVSSFEEFAAQATDYPCCTFRGSMLALEASTGQQIWKTYVIREEPKPTRKNSQGMQLFAPAGASVWNSPTVDVERHAIYFGTGDAETEPAVSTSDAIMALDMNTGEVLWTFQGTENDSYLVGCPGPGKKRSDNCPKVQGPDWDFGASPILRTLAGGHTILIAAQKSGNVFGLDPDKRGTLLWKVNVETKRPRQNPVLVWGGAADEQNAYFGLTSGGMVAIRLADGARQWSAPIVAKGFSPVRAGMAAAATAVPGAVFVGGWDGTLHALSTADGRRLWEFKTAKKFATVNHVVAKGGSFGAPGPTIAGGMLFVGSGYGVFGDDIPGNVLLAFSVE
jgi:polyvinyl alcohol dehydrogenase (cytochrome)